MERCVLMTPKYAFSALAAPCVYDFAAQDALDVALPQALRVTLDIRGIPEIFFDDAVRVPRSLTRLAASRAPIFAAQPERDGTLL
jgi:hypothetical protein